MNLELSNWIVVILTQQNEFHIECPDLKCDNVVSHSGSINLSVIQESGIELGL